METPYEFYDSKLGVKVSYLISDRGCNAESLNLLAYRSLKYRLDSKTRPEQQLRRASLGYEALVQFSSLSREWKDALIMNFGSPQEEVKKSWFSQQYEPDPKARDFFEAYRLGDDGKKLDRALIDRYIANASVLNTVLKMKANRKAYAKALGCTSLDIWESLSRDVNAFRECDHSLPSTSRGLQNVVKRYVSEGYDGLISKKLQNMNAAKVKDDDQLALLDELLAKHTNLDNVQVANIYNTVAGIQGWKTITPVTVGNRKESNALVIYAGRNGTQKFFDNKLMQNKRSKPSASLLYWTIDGWDAELLYQATEVNKRGHSITTYHNRLTIVVVLDPVVKYPIGYAIGTHETPELIKAALRNAFHHVTELFGQRYRPYQIQTDRYQIKTMLPIYEACAVRATPTNAKSKKSKVIEPWFSYFNTNYCQYYDNWSGYNVETGSENQPNDEVLNQKRHEFPDQEGCRQQLVISVEKDREKHKEAFLSKWNDVSEADRTTLSLEMYLKYLGVTTGYSNRLQPEGLTPKLLGVERAYDSFDMNFRRLAHIDWIVRFDPADLSKVLVIDAETKGREAKELGNYQFILEEKYIQPMALADQKLGDALELHKVKAFNKQVMDFVSEERANNYDILSEMFLRKPELNGTLAKLMLVDSRGQHKDRANAHRINTAATKLIETAKEVETEATQQSWQDQQREYHNSKVNLNDYLT